VSQVANRVSPVLEVTGLRKSYGGHVVLHDVDLTVHPHDVVCLIGASGSGKSTLLRCLNLLEDIDDGVIRFDGREISDPRVDVRGVRSRIGMVFQAYNLFPHLSVLDNCTLAPRRVHGLSRAAAERLLLDEITAALDPELVGDVLRIVRDLAGAGTTMVLATHEMAFAREVATTVCFLHEGRILEQGPPEQIFTNPREERTRQFLRRVL
jgi:polar amino acid transport system ATP-binding protein